MAKPKSIAQRLKDRNKDIDAAVDRSARGGKKAPTPAPPKKKPSR